MVEENVAMQSHYQNAGIDSIEIMRKNFGTAEYVGFLKGNVIKYIFRYQMKDGIKDLKKAWVYLTWHICYLTHPSKPMPKNIGEILEAIIEGKCVRIVEELK